MHHTANHLALSQLWVDDVAAVLHRQVALDLNMADVRIHLDLAHMAGAGVGLCVTVEMHRLFQPRVAHHRQGIAGHAFHQHGQPRQRDAVRPIEAEHLALAQAQHGDLYTKHRRGHLDHLVAQIAGGLAHCIAGHDGLATGKAAMAKADHGGVAGQYLDGLRPQSEMRRAQLDERGLQALTHGQRTGVDGNRARGLNLEPYRFIRPPPGWLDRMRDRPAAQTPPALGGLSPRRETRPIGRLDRARLQRGKVARIDGQRQAGTGLQGFDVRDLVGRNQVALTAFRRIEPHFAGQAVHQSLHHESGLRITGTADGGHRHFIGVHHRHIEVVGRHDVGTSDGRCCVVGHIGALRRVGTVVVDHGAAQAANLAIAVGGHLHRPILITLLHRRDEMLAPVFHPLDRPTQLARQRRDHHLFWIDHELGTETAADFGRNHPQTLLGLPEHQRQRVVQFMGHLGGRPHRQGAGGLFNLGQHTAAFHRMASAPVHPEVFADQHLRLGEFLVGGAIGQHVMLQDVGGQLGAYWRRFGPHRLSAVGHHRQGLVTDLNQAGRVFGHMTAAGHDHCNGLAYKSHLVIDQHKRRRVFRQRRQCKTQRHAPGSQLAKQVLLDVNPHHTRDRTGPLGVDGDNARMCLRAAHKAGVAGIVYWHVVEESRLTAQ